MGVTLKDESVEKWTLTAHLRAAVKINLMSKSMLHVPTNKKSLLR